MHPDCRGTTGNCGPGLPGSKNGDYLDDHDACILERTPLERLAQEGQLMAYRHGGCFHAMDTYRDYQYLNSLWDAGQADWKVW